METILHKHTLSTEGSSNSNTDDLAEYRVPMEPQIRLSRNLADYVPALQSDGDPVSRCVLTGLLGGAFIGCVIGLLTPGSMKELLLIGATAGLIAGMAVGLMRRYLEFHNTRN